uniref:Transposase n=1 Tax=Acrobeloides nanus TaxID=290746 RepID=A0A914CY38_9BILA
MGPKPDPNKSEKPKKAISKEAISSPVKTSKIVSLDRSKLATDTSAIISTMKAHIVAEKEKSSDSETLTMMEMLIAIFEQQQVILNHLLATKAPMLATDLATDAEEKERKRSIVISGLSEAVSDTGRGKFKEDKAKVEALLDELDVECGVVHVYRMGKPMENRSRLVKVVLPTSFYQSQCLKFAKNLKTVSGYDGIYIRPSMTKDQLQADYELRKKLREMNKNGIKHRIYRGEIVPIQNPGN